MSDIVNAFTPSSRIARFSPSSTSRRPMNAIRRIDRSLLEREMHRHPVHVAARRGERRVDVAVRVDPDHARRAPRARATPAIVPIAIE
jgi:hypothetical protein